MFGQYCRIETAAGGLWCSDRAFIRQCLALLAPGWHARKFREARHKWIREHLKTREAARNTFVRFRL